MRLRRPSRPRSGRGAQRLSLVLRLRRLRQWRLLRGRGLSGLLGLRRFGQLVLVLRWHWLERPLRRVHLGAGLRLLRGGLRGVGLGGGRLLGFRSQGREGESGCQSC